MNLLSKPAAVAVAALALAALPTVAQAHEAAQPFKNCTEAYDAGYSNIPKGDAHYGRHLDRDNDGVGCDNPPAGFVSADDKKSDDTKSDAGADTGSGEGSGTGEAGAAKEATGQQGTDLAETGGSDSTPYLAAGGAAVVLAGGGLLLAVNRRRSAGTR